MIQFTQYLRPNGRPRLVTITLDEEAEDKARRIRAAGFVFEIEELTNGMVSATIADPEQDEDLVFSITANGPEVPVGLRKMIMEFQL